MPYQPAAVASTEEGKKARVAFVCRDDESVSDVLRRLGTGLGKAMAHNTIVDEVLPELQRSRSL